MNLTTRTQFFRIEDHLWWPHSRNFGSFPSISRLNSFYATRGINVGGDQQFFGDVFAANFNPQASPTSWSRPAGRFPGMDSSSHRTRAPPPSPSCTLNPDLRISRASRLADARVGGRSFSTCARPACPLFCVEVKTSVLVAVDTFCNP